MLVYCTSRNHGPQGSSFPATVLYLGTSVKLAEEAVGDFSKYQKDENKFPVNFMDIYSAIPKKVVDWELIQYFAADGWWYSIVMFELNDKGD